MQVGGPVGCILSVKLRGVFKVQLRFKFPSVWVAGFFLFLKTSDQITASSVWTGQESELSALTNEANGAVFVRAAGLFSNQTMGTTLAIFVRAYRRNLPSRSAVCRLPPKYLLSSQTASIRDNSDLQRIQGWSFRWNLGVILAKVERLYRPFTG